MSVPAWMSAFGVPALGFVIDKIGRRQYFIILAAFFLTLGFFLNLILPFCDQPRDYYD